MVALLAPFGAASIAQEVPTALVATVDGPITPVTAEYLADGIRTAEDSAVGAPKFVAGGADGGVRGLRCRFFVFASGHAARVSTSNRKGASPPGSVGPGGFDRDAGVAIAIYGVVTEHFADRPTGVPSSGDHFDDLSHPAEVGVLPGIV
jgi:hypothetical protein